MAKARTYYRRVSSSAPPSKANWDADQPRACRDCHRKLRITKDTIFMRRYPVRESLCKWCTPKWSLRRAAQVVEA